MGVTGEALYIESVGALAMGGLLGERTHMLPAGALKLLRLAAALVTCRRCIPSAILSYKQCDCKTRSIVA
jgi:hypothetical protein